MRSTSDILDTLHDRINRQENYIATFESTSGRKVLQHLCQVGYVVKPSFVAGDPYTTAYNEGQRALVLSILRQVNKDPTALIKQIETSIQ